VYQRTSSGLIGKATRQPGSRFVARKDGAAGNRLSPKVPAAVKNKTRQSTAGVVTQLLPYLIWMIEIRGYIDEKGNKRFAQWLDGLDAAAAAKVTLALARMEQGNFSNVKGVGFGVFEYKIDLGPGYRIYFGKNGDRLVILIGGG
jgi:putative addiction module killer protein